MNNTEEEARKRILDALSAYAKEQGGPRADVVCDGHALQLAVSWYNKAMKMSEMHKLMTARADRLKAENDALRRKAAKHKKSITRYEEMRRREQPKIRARDAIAKLADTGRANGRAYLLRGFKRLNNGQVVHDGYCVVNGNGNSVANGMTTETASALCALINAGYEVLNDDT